MVLRGRIGIWRCWFLRREENRSTRRKTSRSKGENQQQTQPTNGVDVGIWTRATLVGGECSHHCAIPWQSGKGKCQKVSCTFRGFVLLLRFVAISFSRFLLHCRVCFSSLVALPRNSSFATISLKNQLLDIPVPEAFHVRFPVTSFLPTKLLVAREKKPLVPRLRTGWKTRKY